MRNRKGWVIFLITLAILGIGYAYIPSQGVETVRYDECKIVKRGDTLTKLFGKERAKLATLNGAKLKNPNLIRAGQRICAPAKVKADVKQTAKPTKAKAKQAVKSTKASAAKVAKAPKAKPVVTKSPDCINLGTAPFNWTNSLELRLKGVALNPDLSPAEKIEAKAKIQAGHGKRQLITGDMVWKSMPFRGKDNKITFLKNKSVCTTEQGGRIEAMETWTLSTGTVIGDPLRCGNIGVVVIPKKPVPVVIPPVKEIPPEPIVPVEPPKVEPPIVSPPPEEHFIVPVHAKEGDSIPCNAQAGAGVYANRVYKGAWGYGEALCYVFKNGEWQHGPGFYAMAGGGQSGVSSYRNKETGIGLQYGVQRNWINDRGFKSTFEVKARWLLDRMWGSNPDSGYTVNQKGQKFGLYSTYFERHGDNLVGVIGEYWKSFGQTVKSSWSGQPVQDRGSLGVYGVYEHKLGDGDDWRLRWIAGAQHTNWDSQNWFRFIPEFRYKEWLMFGPQVALPIGVSQSNRPMSVSDLTTVGAFVRVELGTEIRKADATSREEQVEFIPATEAANPSE